MRCLLRPLIAIRIKATYEIKAVLFFSYTFHNITGVDEPCQCEDNLEGTMSHFYVLVLQKTP